MAGPLPDHRVVIDPALELSRPLRHLLPTLDISEQLSEYDTAPVAVLSVATARVQLPAIPASTTVIVIANRQDRDQSLDLYAIGAGMVITEPPLEEIAARIRAVVRHLRQLHGEGHRYGALATSTCPSADLGGTVNPQETARSASAASTNLQRRRYD